MVTFGVKKSSVAGSGAFLDQGRGPQKGRFTTVKRPKKAKKPVFPLKTAIFDPQKAIFDPPGGQIWGGTPPKRPFSTPPGVKSGGYPPN